MIMGRKPSLQARVAMQELQQTTMPDPAEVLEERPPDNGPDLRQGDVDLIAALLMTRTHRDAAQLAGISEATLYRRLKNAGFRRALLDAQSRYLEETVDVLARRERAWAAATGLGVA
jgi:hypothetical protein